MPILLRAFTEPSDYLIISQLLQNLYRPDNPVGNWFQPMWEHAYTHHEFDESAVSRIGLWEDRGEVVGVATYERYLGEAFFQCRPGYEYLKGEMLAYAEGHLAAVAEDGHPQLRAYIDCSDVGFSELARSRGYVRKPDQDHPMSQMAIPSPFPDITVPEGYRIQSLADENDLLKVDRVLWRGFNSPGEPPAGGALRRAKMQSGPNFRPELAMVAVARDDAYASYAGLWFDRVNRLAYVEPVATDPNHRRRGLGTAALLSGIRRCAEFGATVAYVRSDLPFYLRMGFRRLSGLACWSKII